MPLDSTKMCVGERSALQGGGANKEIDPELGGRGGGAARGGGCWRGSSIQFLPLEMLGCKTNAVWTTQGLRHAQEASTGEERQECNGR